MDKLVRNSTSDFCINIFIKISYFDGLFTFYYPAKLLLGRAPIGSN